MSENFFDENVRKKLESIQPEYSEAAWQKLKRSLPVPWYLSFLRDFGGWIFGGVATVAFLTTYNNNQTIRKENQLLNDKTSTIIKTTEAKSTTDTIYVRQSDTVYLTKYITKYIRAEEKIASDESEELLAKLGQGDRKLTKTAMADGILKSNKPLGSKNSNITNTDKTSQPNQKSTGSLVELPPQAITEDKVAAMVPEDKDLKAKIAEDKGKSLVAEDKVVAMVAEDSNKIKIEKPLIDELIIPEKKAVDPLEQKAAKFSLKNINARFGISTDYMGEHFRSLGPAIEVFLGERFGFNTGLLITGKNEFEFKLPRDFNMGTGKQFEDRYNNYVNIKPEKIKDIEIKSSSIKMPIYFNYYIPLKYKLSFMVTTGTKLDLSVIEAVTFTGQDIAGSSYKNTFENQYKPKLFNNLFYGMGVQYQYKRFAGQFSPYFEFPFGQATYLVPPKKFGINASLKFNLHK